MAMTGLGSDPLEFLACLSPSAVCLSPRYSNYVVDGFCVSPALRLQSSDFMSDAHTICISNETFCTCFAFHSKIRTCIWDSFCSWDLWRFALPTLSHQLGHILVTVSCHASLRMAFSRHDLFDIWTRCILHVPPTAAELVICH